MANFDNYSVLSSVYHKENPEYLRLAIESILNQTVLTNDFVIVKDGPLTDELDCVLELYAQKYPFIRIVSLEKNCGLGAALNYGLKHCKNELVARMDTDDYSMPDRCEKQICEFNKDCNLEICGTNIDEFVSDISIIESTKVMPCSMQDIERYARRRNPFNHPTVMYKKSSVVKYGGYSEGQRGEDIELFTKMIFEGAKGYNIPESLLRYRAAPDQFERRSSVTDAEAVINVMKNNYGRHYISLADYLYVVFTQGIGIIIPKRFGKFLFNALFRNKAR